MNWIWRAAAAALAAVVLAAFPTAAFAEDSDKDGLPNAWERGSTPRGLNLQALGASPRHRDVFVEMSYSRQSGKQYLPCSELDRIYRAFQRAPLKNPDGTTGIRLHIDAGKSCPSRNYDLGGSGRFEVGLIGGCATPADVGSGLLAEKRRDVFRVGGMVAPSQMCGGGEAGFATETDFVVADSRRIEFAYVGLHELGHTFGLDHQPFNGLSVMGGSLYPYSSDGSGSTLSAVDFTRYPINALDETALDEHVGYSSPAPGGNTWLSRWYGAQYCDHDGDPATAPWHTMTGPAHGGLDFNCSGFLQVPPYEQYIDDGLVTYDVDGDGVIGTVPAVQAEWPLVNLGQGRVGP